MFTLGFQLIKYELGGFRILSNGCGVTCDSCLLLHNKVSQNLAANHSVHYDIVSVGQIHGHGLAVCASGSKSHEVAVSLWTVGQSFPHFLNKWQLASIPQVQRQKA